MAALDRINFHALFLRCLLLWTNKDDEYLEDLNKWNQLLFDFELAKLIVVT